MKPKYSTERLTAIAEGGGIGSELARLALEQREHIGALLDASSKAGSQRGHLERQLRDLTAENKRLRIRNAELESR